jgi:hypothetical protein
MGLISAVRDVFLVPLLQAGWYQKDISTLGKTGHDYFAAGRDKSH